MFYEFKLFFKNGTTLEITHGDQNTLDFLRKAFRRKQRISSSNESVARDWAERHGDMIDMQEVIVIHFEAHKE